MWILFCLSDSCLLHISLVWFSGDLFFLSGPGVGMGDRGSAANVNKKDQS